MITPTCACSVPECATANSIVRPGLVCAFAFAAFGDLEIRRTGCTDDLLYGHSSHISDPHTRPFTKTTPQAACRRQTLQNLFYLLDFFCFSVQLHVLLSRLSTHLLYSAAQELFPSRASTHHHHQQHSYDASQHCIERESCFRADLLATRWSCGRHGRDVGGRSTARTGRLGKVAC